MSTPQAPGAQQPIIHAQEITTQLQANAQRYGLRVTYYEGGKEYSYWLRLNDAAKTALTGYVEQLGMTPTAQIPLDLTNLCCGTTDIPEAQHATIKKIFEIAGRALGVSDATKYADAQMPIFNPNGRGNANARECFPDLARVQTLDHRKDAPLRDQILEQFSGSSLNRGLPGYYYQSWVSERLLSATKRQIRELQAQKKQELDAATTPAAKNTIQASIDALETFSKLMDSINPFVLNYSLLFQNPDSSRILKRVEILEEHAKKQGKKQALTEPERMTIRDLVLLSTCRDRQSYIRTSKELHTSTARDPIEFPFIDLIISMNAPETTDFRALINTFLDHRTIAQTIQGLDSTSRNRLITFFTDFGNQQRQFVTQVSPTIHRTLQNQWTAIIEQEQNAPTNPSHGYPTLFAGSSLPQPPSKNPPHPGWTSHS